jgi:hypothetical protein
MKQDELNELLAMWQYLLRLQDWDIKAKFARVSTFDVGQSEGEVNWVLSKRQAIVKILDPVDYPEDAGWPQDAEQTLVHELLHLHFAPFDAESGSPELTAQEQAIEAISKALVGIKRGDKCAGSC